MSTTRLVVHLDSRLYETLFFFLPKKLPVPDALPSEIVSGLLEITAYQFSTSINGRQTPVQRQLLSHLSNHITSRRMLSLSGDSAGSTDLTDWA